MPLLKGKPKTPGMARVLTMGEISKLCGVAPRTASKWVDSGILPGYRIPGSRDRRVAPEDFETFVAKMGIRLRMPYTPSGSHATPAEPPAVLAVGFWGSSLDALDAAFGASARVEAASGIFEAGMRFVTARPTCVVVDLAIGDIDACVLAAAVRGAKHTPCPALVAVTGSDPDEPSARRVAGSYDLLLPNNRSSFAAIAALIAARPAAPAPS